MKLTNEEVAKVFLMYYFSECTTVQHPPFEKGTVNIGAIPTDADYFKLLLTPLAKIGDEDAIEVAKVYTGNIRGRSRADKYELIRAGKETVNLIIEGTVGFVCSIDVCFAYQYLISKGYAVPLFFAPNHWANGKTAIELNIAIDKTEVKC